MRAGDLRHQVTIQQFESIDDGGGGHEEVWTDLTTVWGSVEPLNGKERYDAQQIQATLSHKIRIRYYPNLKPSMRVKFETRVFNILSIINFEERNRELQLMCEELI